MIELIIHNNRIGPVRNRHPWIFSGAIKYIPDGIASGTFIKLKDEAGHFLASGYFNSYSQIAVRVWGWDEAEEIDDDFFVRRIDRAYDFRKKLIVSSKTDSYRLINSENDLLPGLIVDKYADYLVVQFHNRGIESWKDPIVAALRKIVKPKGIYERSDVGNRLKEGEEKKAGLLWGKIPERVTILENGYKFLVDLAGGQKTGFFLDQRDKRAALEKYTKGERVLNCFSYTGGFSVYALGGGAKFVESVDTSQAALDIARENIVLNDFSLKKCAFICADVKDYLAKESQKLTSGDEYDPWSVIVLDPPAFIKDRRKIHEGVQGYRRINEMAMRIAPKNGILVSASCSQHLSLVDFRYMFSEAAGRAARTVQILETFTHGIDHPELAAFTEGEYLKCFFTQVN